MSFDQSFLPAPSDVNTSAPQYTAVHDGAHSTSKNIDLAVTLGTLKLQCV